MGAKSSLPLRNTIATFPRASEPDDDGDAVRATAVGARTAQKHALSAIVTVASRASSMRVVVVLAREASRARHAK
jgi:hypothetical protein